MIIQKKNNGPGRPPVNLDWPEGEFTAKQIAENLGGALSRVSVHSKIKKALSGETPELKVVRKVKPKVGRPEIVYATVEKCQTD
tara:strand:- start:232 stop:483 length:252 start_codon:yes stop_codon:yes gene_type:complete